jgi:hypothetical protein
VSWKKAEKRKKRNTRAELPRELRAVPDVVADVLGTDEDVGSVALLDPIDEGEDHVTLRIEGRTLTATAEASLALLRTAEAAGRNRGSA